MCTQDMMDFGDSSITSSCLRPQVLDVNYFSLMFAKRKDYGYLGAHWR